MILWSKLIIHFHEVMLALSCVLSRQNQLRVMGYNLQNFVRELGPSTCYSQVQIIAWTHVVPEMTFTGFIRGRRSKMRDVILQNITFVKSDCFVG